MCLYEGKKLWTNKILKTDLFLAKERLRLDRDEKGFFANISKHSIITSREYSA